MSLNSSESLAPVIGAIVSALRRESPGVLAQLKRDAGASQPSLAFYRFAAEHLPQSWEQQSEAWRALIGAFARLGASAHDPNCELGAALAAAGLSEARLSRALVAPEETLAQAVNTLVRFIAAKRGRVDFLEIARLALTRDAQKGEAVRRRIALSYYRSMRSGART